MSKKTNLSGKCLALTLLWNYQFQYYGKFSFFLGDDFFIFFFLNNLFVRLLNFDIQYFISKTQYFIYISQVILIFSTKFINYHFLYRFYSFLFLFWSYNLNSQISLKILFYLEKNQFFSSRFLKSYILYLIYNKNISPKKIFNLLMLTLRKNKFQSILSISKKGLIKNQFIGFKIQLKGRYESTRNEMANQLIIRDGNINSTNLNFTISYINHFFYTKLGTSTLKIWLFYL
uniref:Ribosomal protein S3 n=1 Tax=Pterosiphonia complanata TaxID=884089 RepID=UPI0022FD7082|nr:Ribosomal protein S3 [Pterosiphonia complanata]WAX04087.1 Ribosomal protein S3 [Pterosiphonia complanata]